MLHSGPGKHCVIYPGFISITGPFDFGRNLQLLVFGGRLGLRAGAANASSAAARSVFRAVRGFLTSCECRMAQTGHNMFFQLRGVIWAYRCNSAGAGVHGCFSLQSFFQPTSTGRLVQIRK